MFKTLGERVDPAHTALLVIDVQNDFIHSDGYIARQGRDQSLKQNMVPRLLWLLERARASVVPVIFIRQWNSPHVMSPASVDQRLRTFPGSQDYPCHEESWGAGFYQVAPLPGEAVVSKHRYSAFIDTNLDLLLRSKGIRTLILTGVNTNMCVESTARDGFMRDYFIVFLSDCTATNNVEDHESTLRNMRYGFAVVTTAEETAAAWKTASK
jgi:ureidoacrylate peracid hydrolase